MSPHLQDWFTYLLPAGSAGAGSLISYLLLKGRMRRLERRMTAVLRLLLQSSQLTQDQKSLMEAILQDDPLVPA